MKKVSKIVQGLNEMSPQYIGDLTSGNSSLLDKVKNRILKLHPQFGKKLPDLFNSDEKFGTLYEIDSFAGVMPGNLKKHKYIYLIDSDGELVYFTAYSIHNKYKQLPRKSVTQVLVWKASGKSRETYISAKRIVWDYLFVKSKCIVTDSQQTKAGADLWYRLCQEGIRAGKVVRYFNAWTGASEDYTTLDELRVGFDTHYGSDASFQYDLLAIFDKA